MLYYHFYLVQCMFLISPETSSLTHGLFRSVLFIFLLSFCYFEFNSIVVEGHIQYDFNSFQFAEVCFIAQGMTYLGFLSIAQGMTYL